VTPGKKGKGKKKKIEEPPPPPPPPPVHLQVRSISWRCMDFRCILPPETPLSELEELIKQRHSNKINTMSLYHDDVKPEKALKRRDATINSVDFGHKTPTGEFEVFYDYLPVGDPFEHRPFAALLHATNPMVAFVPVQAFSLLSAS